MRTLPLLPSFLLILTAQVANAQDYGSTAPVPAGGIADAASPTKGTEEAKDPDALIVTVEGQVRLREELQRYLFWPDTSGNTSFDLTHLRTRAALGLKRDNLSLIVEMQDIRWLGQAGTTEDSEGMDLRRGALKIDRIFDSNTSFEAGRMALKYGDQRLIGSLEWVNQARTFDGAKLRIVPERYFIDAWLDVFFTVTRETKDAHDDQYFGGAYASAAPGAKGWKSEAYALTLVDRLEVQGESGTGKTAYAILGTRQAYKHKGVDAAVELVTQVGTKDSDDFRAYGGAVRAAYTVESTYLKPRVGAEFVLGSGDDDPTDGTQKTFQNLFPTNHLHYGYADQAGWSNLTAAKASAGFGPNKLWKANVDYYHLRLTDPAGGWFNAGGKLVRGGIPNASSHLGDEVDVVGKYWWRKGLVVEAGYGLFIPGGFVQDTGGGHDVAHFGYLQLAASLK